MSLSSNSKRKQQKSIAMRKFLNIIRISRGHFGRKWQLSSRLPNFRLIVPGSWATTLITAVPFLVITNHFPTLTRINLYYTH